MAIQWLRKQDRTWTSSNGITVLGLDKRPLSDCPQVQVAPGDGAPSYSSDNRSVVRIDPSTGELILQGQPGVAKITATLSNGGADFYTITVQEIEAVISFPDYLSSSASISVKNGLNINPLAKSKVEGANAGTSFTYTASNSIVAVDTKGHVTAGATAGIATITVTLNSNQYTAAQATFVVQVLDAQGDVIVVNATSNATVVTVSGGAKPGCQIAAMMTINGKPPANVSYTYKTTAPTSIATINSASGQVTSGVTPGIVEITVTGTVPATAAEYAGVSGSTLVVITVVAADGDNNTPRPVGYPSYSGTETPTIEAVKKLLQALMYDDPNNPADDIDQPASVAAQLFGLDYAYFAAIAPDLKKVVFPINETNNIYQASSSATSHLQLKVTKELVLGDNISFSAVRGNTFNVNINLNNKVDKTGQDANNDGIDDSVQTGHGVTNTSITGIASEVKLGVNEVIADDLYSYTGSPGTGKNYVYLPRLKTLKLDYGSITSYRADRAITFEFMGPEGDTLDASRCSYASFQLVSKDLFHPKTQSNETPGTLFSPNIGDNSPGKSLRDPGMTIAPDEKNLGLLQDYFKGSGSGDGYMAKYDKIGLPREFLADSVIDYPGVNVLQFTKGKSRLVYEYLDGMIKQYWLANILVATTIVAAVRVAVAMVFIHKLDYFQVNYNNHNNAALTLNLRLQPLDANFDLRLINCGIDVSVFNNEEYFGWVAETYWGPTTKCSNAISIEAGIVTLAARWFKNEWTVNKSKTKLAAVENAKNAAEKVEIKNKIRAAVVKMASVSLHDGVTIES